MRRKDETTEMTNDQLKRAILESMIRFGPKHQHRSTIIGGPGSRGNIEHHLDMDLSLDERAAAARMINELVEDCLLRPTFSDPIDREGWLEITDIGKARLALPLPRPGEAEGTKSPKDLRVQSVDGIAAILLRVLRENLSGQSRVDYHPGSLIDILGYEFEPRWQGRKIQGGVELLPGMARHYVPHRAPPELSDIFRRAVEELRSGGLIRQDREQRNENFVELTDEGSHAEILAGIIHYPREATFWAKRYKGGVLLIEGRTAEGDICSGTAFLAQGSLLATCAHVAEPAVHLVIGQDRFPVIAKVKHRVADLALLEVRGADLSSIQPLPVRVMDVNPPEPVLLLGYPRVPRHHPTVTAKETSVEAVSFDYDKKQLLRFADAVSGGMSGAPVLNRRGFVVGVVSENTFEGTGDGLPRREFTHGELSQPLVELLAMNSLPGR